jgi:3-dehydrotetronate 4-kinase
MVPTDTDRDAGLILGVIADDFTGATDIGGMLVRGGMRVVQTVGTPSPELMAAIDADAVIIALKSRSIAADEAVQQSLEACRVLRDHGAQCIYFKYCSTFDSTPEGNIGPVAEALADYLGATFIPYVPSLPENGRSIFHGHMFVFDKLLNESPMRNHPLNPMTDSNLVRWLDQQTRDGVDLLPLSVIEKGAAAVTAHCDTLADGGQRHIIADTVRDANFAVMAEAFVDCPLITGGSGLATALARLHGGTTGPDDARILTPAKGRKLILAGSASAMTLVQIDDFIAKGGPAKRLEPRELAKDAGLVKVAIDWAGAQSADRPILIYGSGTPEQVRASQAELGREKAGEILERALSDIAVALHDDSNHPARQMIVAGGETSGAVVAALGVKALRIGPEIGPGVPWTEAQDEHGGTLGHLALKSGNFGAADFFTRAFDFLE